MHFGDAVFCFYAAGFEPQNHCTQRNGGSMKVRNTMRVCSILLTVCLVAGRPLPVCAQEREHAVSPGQLRTDVQKSAATRQANEAAVREMFASEAGRQALKSAGMDYQKVDQAIGQVSDEDLARMAERSREVQKDFAAGRLGDRDLLIILLVAVALILIIVAVR
jgi:pyruvate/2-oxoglutarate dehydrogenase complex dihydrolipoamide acyltransferase (E2) component